MKNLLLFSTLFAALCISLVLACGKKLTPTSGPTTTWTSSLHYTPQTFAITAGRDTIVMGKDSTVLHFYPNSFMTSTGNIITTGSINIQLIEMYSPGAMIANGATTATTDGSLLNSGGQVYIKASMNGQEVFANKYGLGFRQPGSSTTPMEIFYGSTGNADSAVKWTVSDTTKTGTTAAGTSTDSSASTTTNPHPNFMYIFDSCTSFSWINCDQFSGNGAQDKIFFQVPDATYTSANTIVFFVLPGTNSVEKGEYSGDGKFLIAHIAGNVAYKAVGITNKNNSYYYWEQTGTTTNDHSVITVPMAMAPETLGDIITRLHGL